MISGHPRYLDITQNLYMHWNNLYDNVDFDFFVSTWYDDTDYSDWDWIRKWERLYEHECPYDLDQHPSGHHQPHYAYGIKRVNDLRNSVDEEYDAVLQIRPDCLVPKKLIDSWVSQINNLRGDWDTRVNTQITPRNIFTPSRTSMHSVYLSNHKKWVYNYWTMDDWFFGHPKVMDKFSNMFDYIWIDKKYSDNTLMHIFPAEYLHQIGIHNMSLNSMNVLYIRESDRFDSHDTITLDSNGNKIYQGGWEKVHPSSRQLTETIEEFGVEWIFDMNNWAELKNNFRDKPK